MSILANKRMQRFMSVLLALTLILQLAVYDNTTVNAEANSNTEYSNDVLKEASIEYEAEEFRTKYSKSYRRSDGTYLQITSVTPIHYFDGDHFEEIDNNLVKKTNKKDEIIYQNKGSNYQVSFPDKLSRPIKITNEDYTISMIMASDDTVSKKSIDNSVKKKKINLKELKKEFNDEKGYEGLLPEENKGEIIYENEEGGLTVSYQSFNDKIKESIIINSLEDVKDSYVYKINAEGLKAAK